MLIDILKWVTQGICYPISNYVRTMCHLWRGGGSGRNPQTCQHNHYGYQDRVSPSHGWRRCCQSHLGIQINQHDKNLWKLPLNCVNSDQKPTPRSRKGSRQKQVDAGLAPATNFCCAEECKEIYAVSRKQSLFPRSKFLTKFLGTSTQKYWRWWVIDWLQFSEEGCLFSSELSSRPSKFALWKLTLTSLRCLIQASNWGHEGMGKSKV